MAKREVVAGSAHTVGKWTMQVEYVKCGKDCKTCTTRRGARAVLVGLPDDERQDNLQVFREEFTG
jgi:hypothetical protein